MSSILLAVILMSTGCSIREVYTGKKNISPPVSEAGDSIRHSVFLIGDAGEPVPEGTEPNFRTITTMASVQSGRNTIIFLGDNIYPKGLPPPESPDRKEMERRLDEQIAIGTATGARTLFVPGNHDWEYQGKNGLQTIRRQEEYIALKGFENVTLLPKNGTPGPHAVDVSDALRIIVIDTQWWLHAFEKPYYPGDTSEAQTRQRWLDSLSLLLSGPEERATIVVAHHPLRTYGEHGGFFDWKDHLFPLRKLNAWLWIPLPGLGSLYPLSRIWGISDQDLSGTRNREMVHAIDSVLSRHRPLAYAAGHEHTLQVIDKHASHYYLISGNGVEKHSEALTYGDDTLLASREKGFMRLDLLMGGNMRLGVISSDGREIYSMMLR